MNPILLDFPHEFETERLVIRCPLPGDGTMVYEAMVESHAEVRKWMPWAINLPVVEEVEENVRRAHVNFILREDLRLHLFLKASGRFVGSTGLHRINWDVRRFEIGYWIRTAESGRGLATEAVHGLVRWASEYLNTMPAHFPS